MEELAVVTNLKSSRGDSERLLDIDPETLRAHYNRTPFLIRHCLSEHPLLQLDSLIELINRLPRESVRHCRGSVPLDTDFDQALIQREHELSLEDVLSDLEHKDAYVLIHDPEADAVYRRFIGQLMAELKVLVEPLDPGFSDAAAYIFIVSPGAVTPYHQDREANFLCQVSGTKTMQLWDPADRSIMREEDFETLLGRPTLPKPPYKPEYAAKAQSFPLGPGLGVHHPFAAPHASRSGDEISIAIALTFRSRAMKRRSLVHRANYALRRIGVRPRPYGESPRLDTLKQLAFEGYLSARSLPRRGAQR